MLKPVTETEVTDYISYLIDLVVEFSKRDTWNLMAMHIGVFLHVQDNYCLQTAHINNVIFVEKHVWWIKLQCNKQKALKKQSFFKH